MKFIKTFLILFAILWIGNATPINAADGTGDVTVVVSSYDFTASTVVVSPNPAQTDIEVTFSANLINKGTENYTGRLDYFFQIKNLTTLSIEDGDPFILSSGLSLNSNVPVSATYTFDTKNNYGIRVCVDKISSSSPPNGVIEETDETNNCSSPWTTVSVAQTVAPTVTTTQVTNKTKTTAVSGGSVTSNGGAPVTRAGIVWRTVEPFNINIGMYTGKTQHDNWADYSGWSDDMTGLSCNKYYYVKAYATNLAGTNYGNSIQFITSLCGPNLTALAPTFQTSVVAGSSQTFTSIVKNIGDSHTVNSFYNLLQVKNSAGAIIESKVSSLMNAIGPGNQSNTLISYTFSSAGSYSVRVCADNNASFESRVTESQEADNCNYPWVTVNVSGVAPTVTTKTPITSITKTTAVGGGTTGFNGGSDIIQAGLVWGFSSPTMSSYVGITSDGWAIGGPWLSTMTGLSCNTKYYVKAYGQNSDLLIGYGNEVSFTTLPCPPNLVAYTPTSDSTTAVVGIPKIFTSVIKNIGGSSTVNSFYNLFQKNDSQPDIFSSLMYAVGPGATDTTSTSYTFTNDDWYVNDFYEIRACADKTSSAGGGVITESNEGDNCSSYFKISDIRLPWVTITPSSPYNVVRNSSINFNYTASTETGNEAECRLLDNTKTPLVTYYQVESDGPLVRTAPSAPGPYSYYIQCRDIDVPSAETISSIIYVYVKLIVTFDKNGGTTDAVPSSKTVNYGGSVVTLPTPPTWTGVAVFNGWATSNTAIIANFFADTNVTSDTTVYAVWTINKYTVSTSVKTDGVVSGVGGSISPTSKVVDYNGTVSFTMTPTVTIPTVGYKIGTVSASGCTIAQVDNTNVYTTGLITSPCTVSVNFVKMTGDLTANTPACLIDPGTNSCDINDVSLGWSIVNSIGNTTAITSSGMTDVNLTVPPYSGTAVMPISISYNSSKIFFLYNNGIKLDEITPTAECNGDTAIWDAKQGICISNMTGTLSAASCKIGANSSTCGIKLTWNTIKPIFGSVSAVTTEPSYTVAKGYSNTSITSGSDTYDVDCSKITSLDSCTKNFYLYNSGLLLDTEDMIGVTCAYGTGWIYENNIGKCIPGKLSGELRSLGCSVQEDKSSCNNARVDWTVKNAIGDTLVEANDDVAPIIFSGPETEGFAPYSLTLGVEKILTLKSGTSDVLDSLPMNAYCTSGTSQVGQICVRDPLTDENIIYFTAVPATVFKNKTSTLKWETTNTDSCSLYNTTESKVIDLSGITDTKNGSIVVTPSQTVPETSYKLSCVNSAKLDPINKDASVKVVTIKVQEN